MTTLDRPTLGHIIFYLNYFFFISEEKASTHSVVCYYIVERNISTRLQPEDIDGKLCTHLIVGFAGVRHDFAMPRTYQDLECFNRTTALKKKFPKLKVMLSVGEKGRGGLSRTVTTHFGRER